MTDMIGLFVHYRPVVLDLPTGVITFLAEWGFSSNI